MNPPPAAPSSELTPLPRSSRARFSVSYSLRILLDLFVQFTLHFLVSGFRLRCQLIEKSSLIGDSFTNNSVNAIRVSGLLKGDPASTELLIQLENFLLLCLDVLPDFLFRSGWQRGR